MDSAFAQDFANEWIAAWNAHDLPRVLSHYTDDFVMSSPYIVTLAGEPSGKLVGKKAVEGYWRKALDVVPDLHFELISVLAGANSLVVYYRGARGRIVAEGFHFDADLKVSQSSAHYDIRSAS